MSSIQRSSIQRSSDGSLENPLVTVVVPTYNRRELVQRAIDSVLRQTYRNYELIVVDDGSTDGTREAIEGLSPSLRYVYQENQGLAAARNKAVRLGSGPLIALLDSDDWWLDDKLERCVAYLKEHPEADVVYSPMKTVDEAGQPMRGHNRPGRGGYLLHLLFENIVVHDPAAVFHRRVWENVGGFNERLPVCVGHDFWLRVSVYHHFGYIPEPLAVRTWLPDSLTRGRRARGAVIKAKMLERFYAIDGGRRLLESKSALRALSRAHYSAGKICARNGDVAAGLELLRRAMEYDPRWYKPWAYYVAIKLRHPWLGQQEPNLESIESRPRKAA